jgi:hypothetical protein
MQWGRPYFLLDINTENHTSEVLNLPMSSSLHRQSEDLAFALNNFHALKSLDLSGHKTTPEALIAIFKHVLMPPSRLENLILSRIGGLNNESLSALGECIAANETLKRLDLSCYEWGVNITTACWVSLFRQLRETSSLKLESIDLQHNRYISIGYSVLQELMDLFRSATNLKTVKLGGCGISSDGANRLLNMLHQTSIQNIDTFSATTDEDTENNLPVNFYTMLGNGGLRGLHFGWLSLETCLRLLNSISNPNCNLEKFQGNHNIYTPVEFAQIIFGWADVLKRNSTIKSLRLHCKFDTSDSLVDFWHEYSNLLCDRDTIEATYNSNHSLGSLDLDFKLEYFAFIEDDDAERRIEEACKTLLEVRLLLDLNKDQDTSAKGK